MLKDADLIERRTTTDVVFDRLHEEISALRLLPGTKLSEVEVARRFGVSRQPVRDAFNRLGNLDLLLIRPQRATEVRGFSMEQIAHARFVRLAIELEVVRRACAVWNPQYAELLQQNLAEQEQAVQSQTPEAFHALDRRFHNMICEFAGLPLAIQTIQDCKKKVDRICLLSLGKQHETATLLDDHRRLADALKVGDEDAATDIVRTHLSRLDDTIAEIQKEHLSYFE